MFSQKLSIPGLLVVDLDYVTNGGMINPDFDCSQFVGSDGYTILSRITTNLINPSLQYTTKELAKALREWKIAKAYGSSELIINATNTWLVVDSKTGTHRYTSIKQDEGLTLPPFYFRTPFLKKKVLVKENFLFFASTDIVKPHAGIEQIIVRKGSG